MAKLFVSYSRKDSKTARKLIAAFKEMGQEVWVDWEDIPPAADWLEQIFRGIESSDAFIFIVSPDSIKSEVCNVEIGRAAQNNKRIIPVVIRDVVPDTTNEIIRKLNWTFIRKGESFEEGLAKIKTAIEIDLGWVEEHNRLQSRALVWHRKKDPSLLLRGRDLRNARNLVLTAGKKDPIPTDLQKTYIQYSTRNEQRAVTLWIATAIAVIALAFLAYTANQQSNLATANAIVAVKNEQIAKENADQALKNAKEAQKAQLEAEAQREIAEQQRGIAQEQTKVAQAQRSAARAQIYQSQPGELYTSTLFALDSWETAMTDEAEEILRKNISLLPIPVKQAQREGSINSLEFNSQGDLFATAGADGNACVWKVSDGEMLFCAASSKSVNDAVFSPDGTLLITGDDSGLVQVISVEDGNILYTYEAAAIVWDVDIRKNGDQIAVTRDDGRITLLDAKTGKRKYDLQAFGRLKIASFSPDGRYIAAGSSEGNVTLWNLDDGGAVSSGRHKGEVLSLAFSPDGKYLVTGGADSTAVVAKTLNGVEVYRLLHEDWVGDIAFNPDSSWFATVSNDRRIRLWDTPDGDERLRMSQNSFVKEVKVSANGQWLATTGADRTVRVWNASTGTEMFQIPLKGEGTVIGFSGDGNNLVAGDASGEINVWDISVMPAPENYLQFNGLIGDVYFSPSGDWLAASDGPRVWLLKPNQLSTLTTRSLGDPILTLNGNVSNIVFSPDSVWLGISTENGQALVFNMQTRIPKTISQTGLKYQIAFSPDSAKSYTASNTGIVEEWSLASFGKTSELAGEGSGVTSIAVSPSIIALGMADKISVVGLDGGQVGEIESPGDHPLMTFNADGSLLVSSNSAGLIQIWKYENGNFSLVNSIRKETVYSLAFNPAGTRLTVGTMNAVYLIDPTTVKETARILHAGKVTGISYSADGSTMTTASLKTVLFWDVTKIDSFEADNLVDAACSRLTANFSASQWSNLFGDEEYRVLCEGLPVP
jgi:WD40 repeat protein